MSQVATVIDFDPLVVFQGRWNTELAESYLPIQGLPVGKYECLRGHLIMSPVERPSNSYGELKLGVLLLGQAEAAGYVAYAALNMLFADDTWIEPDLAVLKGRAEGDVWVAAEQVLMPVEFVSPSSRSRDRIEKPKLCAEVGVPWYLRVEIDRSKKSVFVHLSKLERGAYVEHAAAREGERFTIT